MTQVEIDALCREVNAAGLAPGLEGCMRGILEGVMIDLGYEPKSIRADAARIVHRIRHLKSPSPNTIRARPNLGGLFIDDASYQDIVKWVEDPSPRPALADRVEQALAPMVRLADYQWVARQRHRAALLGLLQWQVDKPPPPTLWERLTGDQAV